MIHDGGALPDNLCMHMYDSDNPEEVRPCSVQNTVIQHG